MVSLSSGSTAQVLRVINFVDPCVLKSNYCVGIINNDYKDNWVHHLGIVDSMLTLTACCLGFKSQLGWNFSAFKSFGSQ